MKQPTKNPAASQTTKVYHIGKRVDAEQPKPFFTSKLSEPWKPKNPAAVALGSIRTAKKAAASRENGKRGGRPKGPISEQERRKRAESLKLAREARLAKYRASHAL